MPFLECGESLVFLCKGREEQRIDMECANKASHIPYVYDLGCAPLK
jgi:hypothetical protein